MKKKSVGEAVLSVILQIAGGNANQYNSSGGNSTKPNKTIHRLNFWPRSPTFRDLPWSCICYMMKIYLSKVIIVALFVIENIWNNIIPLL